MARHYVPLFEEICTSEKLAALATPDARLLYLLVLAKCDRHGRMDARPRQVSVKCWPLLDYSQEQTAAHLADLERVGLIEFHSAEDGAFFISVPDWQEKAATVGKRDKVPKSRWPEPSAANRVGLERVVQAGAVPDQPGPSRADSGPPGPAGAEPGHDGPVRAVPRRIARAQDLIRSELSGEDILLAPKASEGGNDLTRIWDRLWEERNRGAFAWPKGRGSGKHPVALANALEDLGGDRAELERRMRAYLFDQDEFRAGKNRTPYGFRDKLNAYVSTATLWSEADREVAETRARHAKSAAEDLEYALRAGTNGSVLTEIEGRCARYGVDTAAIRGRAAS